MGHARPYARRARHIGTGHGHPAPATPHGPHPAFRPRQPDAFRDYRDLLQTAGMRQSMSRKGCCYDNAPMESFFHTLKVELVHPTRFETREQAELRSA